MSAKTFFGEFFKKKMKTEKGNAENGTISEQINKIYFKELAIQTAITLIANAIAMCEIKVFENNKEVKNKFYYRMNVSPNKNENSSQFWHKAIEKLIYENETLLVENNEEFFIADGYIEEERPILGNYFESVNVGPVNFNRKFRYDEVMFLKLNNTNIKYLIDRLDEEYNKLLVYASKSYEKSNQTKYKLIMENIKMGDKAFQENFRKYIKDQLQDFMTADNAVYPQFNGYDLVDMSPKVNTKSSSDFINLGKEMFSMVAQAFQIPISLMLGNVTNIDEVAKIFLTFSIDPIAGMITEESTRKYSKMNYEHWLKGNYTKVDTSTIKHVDIFDISEASEKLIGSGPFNIDDIRVRAGYQALNTDWSKQHFITKNFDKIENMLKGEGGGNNE